MSSRPLHSFVRQFTIEYCRRCSILALTDDAEQDVILVTSTTDPEIIDIVRRSLGMLLKTRVVTETELRQEINACFEQHAKTQYSQEMAPTLDEVLQGSEATRATDLLESDSRGKIVQTVNQLLLEAVQLGASDVHLQPFEDRVAVRMRLDGVLVDIKALSPKVQEEVVSRLKVAGNMDIAEKRLPQDGRATVRVGDRIIDLRLASMPTSFGERVVVRLLDKSARLYRLREIGMDESTFQRFRDIIRAEHGLVLVTGPTGSGKSTTLYAALQELDTKARNAVTLEDPIEYQLDGISQTQINTKKGMTFASGLRSVLRQDPDIIMLGEIRDEETAGMAIQSALTGHMVFSTLHTNDAASAVTRLLELGIEPYLVSSSLLAVLAQRLVRKRCPNCGGENAFSGCTFCRGTGYKGREGIYELLLVDERVRNLIQKRENAAAIRAAAIDNGMELLRECGLRRVAAGTTTIDEIDRVTMRTSL